MHLFIEFLIDIFQYNLVCTGDGDLIMRFTPSSIAVYLLEQGKSASEAAYLALKRVYEKYPHSSAAIVVATKDGDYGLCFLKCSKFPKAWKF